jgi:nucleotidyltransferase substrate binding protein (TIGR01987 family)
MRSEEEPPSLVAFGSALARLGDALAQPKTEWTRDAALQRFEFTVELAWKSIARFARREGLEAASPRQAFRIAFRLGWIDDDQVWLAMLEDRNLTSHTYSEKTAEELFARLHDYQTALSGLLQRLQQFAEPPQPLST